MTSQAGTAERRSIGKSRAQKINPFFVWTTRIFAFGVAALLIWITIQILIEAWPAVQEVGLSFLVEGEWDAANDEYGILPNIVGTIISSIIALIIAWPIAIAVAILLSEDFLPHKFQEILAVLIEMLASIPSVVYGLWGVFVLVPFLNAIGTFLHENFGWIPLFATQPVGPGLHIASVVLAIMILPIITAVARNSIVAVAGDLRQAAMGLGDTRWGIIFKVVLPAAFSGIIGGTMLALGRAFGETIAVTLTIGNANDIPESLFAPAATIASLLANQFEEASGIQVAALMYAAFVLMCITLATNILAELLIRRVQKI